jgi:hypothetical protein
VSVSQTVSPVEPPEVSQSETPVESQEVSPVESPEVSQSETPEVSQSETPEVSQSESPVESQEVSQEVLPIDKKKGKANRRSPEARARRNARTRELKEEKLANIETPITPPVSSQPSEEITPPVSSQPSEEIPSSDNTSIKKTSTRGKKQNPKTQSRRKENTPTESENLTPTVSTDDQSKTQENQDQSTRTEDNDDGWTKVVSKKEKRSSKKTQNTSYGKAQGGKSMTLFYDYKPRRR